MAPSPLEAKLNLSPFVSQCLVYGAGQSRNVALIIVDVPALQSYLGDVSRTPQQMVADPRTRDLLERILRDERRHLGFGENEVARRLREEPSRGSWVAVVKQELDRLVLETIDQAARDLGTSAADAESLGRFENTLTPIASPAVRVAAAIAATRFQTFSIPSSTRMSNALHSPRIIRCAGVKGVSSFAALLRA